MKRPLALLSLLLLANAACAQPAPKNVAILLFDDVQIIDYTGPYEVFGGLFNVYTVAETTAPIKTIYGMKVTPDHAFADAPKPDIVVLPGGGKHNAKLAGAWAHTLPIPDSKAILDWVRATHETADHVLTVCNGAFILARAGLLDGLTATTTAPLLGMLKEVAPKTEVVGDRRFVDNGKVILSAGLSSGIDAALHVVARVRGRGTAQRRALGLEYNWDPEGGWARAALADRYLQFNFRDIDGESLDRSGDRDRWESTWRVTDAAGARDVLARVNAALGAQRSYLAPAVRWTHEADAGTDAAPVSRWRFTDEEGRPWQGLAAVTPEAPGTYLLSVRVHREAGK